MTIDDQDYTIPKEFHDRKIREQYKGGEKMNISKVYYEELKSKCVNGKWESVRIGAEVALENNEIGYKAIEAFILAKDFVRKQLNGEGYDKEKKQKELLEALKVIREEVKKII